MVISMRDAQFPSALEAQQAEQALFGRFRSNAQAAGFLVVDGAVVPKNGATGLDDLAAQRSVRWANVEESLDDLFVVDISEIPLLSRADQDDVLATTSAIVSNSKISRKPAPGDE